MIFLEIVIAPGKEPKAFVCLKDLRNKDKGHLNGTEEVREEQKWRSEIELVPNHIGLCRSL